MQCESFLNVNGFCKSAAHALERHVTLFACRSQCSKREKVVRTEVDFKLLNTTNNEQGYYFTMEVPTEEPVNELKLNFKQDNFDWLLSLEGSQNQQEWFRIVDDYRILSIKNPETNYQFTKVTFPNTKYRFFRFQIKLLLAT